jgi:tRNA pseudouridine38-40 synthase
MEPTYRYFIRMAYNGARYLGWQVQRQSPTVQEVVNETLSTIFRKEINVVGCGRTDTGVHAREFYAHFNLPVVLAKKEVPHYIRKLNGLLPKDIAIYDLYRVTEVANARFSAIRRTYKYHVTTRKDPFHLDSAYTYRTRLDIEKMNAAAAILMEYSDFTSFSKVKTQVKTNNCIIYEASWEQEDGLLVFTITADRFLRNMVRAIVGTLLDVGREKLSLEGFRKVIEKKDRSSAGYSVPAHGLYLYAVDYPKDILY